MLLIGTIHRRELHRAIDKVLCLENKLVFFSRKLGLSVSVESRAANGGQSDSTSQQDPQQVGHFVNCPSDTRSDVCMLTTYSCEN